MSDDRTGPTAWKTWEAWRSTSPLLVASWLVLGAGQAGTVAGQSRRPTGETLPVVEHTLANGMRFLILPRRGAPTVAFVVQYEVGGVNEVRGETGIAHLLEHLLFKGSTTVGTRNLDAELALFAEMDSIHDEILARLGRIASVGDTRVEELREELRTLEKSARTYTISNEFDRLLSRNGARGLNATTDTESTTYFVELPSNRTELWFLLESDRMRNPVFREFYAERDVVMEERRMRVETSPGGLLYQAHLAAAYQVHPYGQPVIGFTSDLEILSRHQVAAYYGRFYGPNNAVVAIVGNVDPDDVIDWADRYFGGIPRGEETAPVLTREPDQRGERRVEVVFDAEPSVRIGWHIPSEFHDDMPALAMLSVLLAGGRTSLLHRRLVQEERIATYIQASVGPGSRYPQLFTVAGAPVAPHTTADIESAVYEELERLAQEPPPQIAIQRVRNQLEAGRVRRLTGHLGLAFQLASSTVLDGDWRTTFRLADRLQAVTPEDVQRAARTYFGKNNRTVATLVKPLEDSVGEPPPGGGR